jgi:hypothetical protein
VGCGTGVTGLWLGNQILNPKHQIPNKQMQMTKIQKEAKNLLLCPLIL